MRKTILVLTAVLSVGCGSAIDKKNPAVADNNEPSNNEPGNNANNASNTTGSNSTTGSNNANNTSNQNNTVNPTNNANNTIAPNNANNTTPPNNANNTNGGDMWTCYTDDDLDGFGTDPQVIDEFCTDVGLVLEGGDCNDDDVDIFPGAPELCDEVDSNCDGVLITVPSECATIQMALDIAAVTQVSGDIVVGAGTYVENIDFKGANAVRLLGAGPQVTTIDGSSDATPTVRFAADEDADTVLEGFTVRGGRGELTMQGRRGGGIYIDDASPTLRNLIVRDNLAGGDSGYGGGISMLRSGSLVERVDVVGNSAGYYGGGIYVALSDDAELRQLRIVDNDALYGGGLALYYSDALVVATAVLSNQAAFGGGALVQANAPKLENITWVGNTGDDGGAMALFSGTVVTIVNNTFSGNNAVDSGGAIYVDEGTPSVRYSNFFDNGAGPLVGLSFNSTVASIQEPPDFVSTSGAPMTWDLHLASGSALIDAGDTALDDFDGTRSDIGAHGGAFGDW